MFTTTSKRFNGCPDAPRKRPAVEVTSFAELYERHES